MRDGICPLPRAAPRDTPHTRDAKPPARSSLAPQPDHAVSSTEGVSCAGSAKAERLVFLVAVVKHRYPEFGKNRVLRPASSASFPTRDQTEHHQSMSLQFITSPNVMVTAETEKLNNEQYGACGSGTVWDLILQSVLPACLPDDVCKSDDMHQNKVAVAAAAGAPEPVATDTSPALLYAVAIPDGAPVVPVPTVPAEEAIKSKTTDSAPVQAEAEELTSGEATTSDAHASTAITVATAAAEIAAAVTCKEQAETWHGLSFTLGMRTSNDTMSVECRGATPTWLRCTASPRSMRSLRFPPTRGFAATRCPPTVVGVFHWEE